MTCDETLQFYAAVVLPDTCTRAQRRVRVHDVLAAVGLSNSSSTLVSLSLAAHHANPYAQVDRASSRTRGEGVIGKLLVCSHSSG